MRKRLLGSSAVLALLSVPRLLGDVSVAWMPSAVVVLPSAPKRALAFPEGVIAGETLEGRRRKKRGRKAAGRSLLDQEFVDAVADLPRAHDGGFWELALADMRAARQEAQGRVRTSVVLPSFKRGYASGPARALSAMEFSARREEAVFKAPLPGAVKAAGDAAPAAQARGAVPARLPRVDYDGRHAASSASGFSASDSGLALGSLQLSSGKPAAAAKENDGKYKEAGAEELLGKGLLKPPSGELEAPGFADLKELFPDTLPDGRAYARGTPSPKMLEGLAPPDARPDYERWLKKDEHRERAGRLPKEAHWHQDDGAFYFHAGKDWAAAAPGHWAWFRKKGARWWSVADGAERMVHHAGRWWWATELGWLPVHEGRPAGLEKLRFLRQGGWMGKEPDLAFSADLTRLAVTADDGRRQVFPLE